MRIGRALLARHRAVRFRCAAVCVLAVLLIRPGSGRAAQGRLVSATLSAGVTAGETRTVVQMSYTLRPAGERRVPVSVVLFDSTRVEGVSIGSYSGNALAFEADPASPADRLSGHVLLSPDEAALNEVRISLMYTIVSRAPPEDRRVQIPVLALTWPPAEARPGTFLATIAVPPGMAAYDATPSVMREIANSAGLRTYEADLQIVPALVSFELTAGTAPRFGLAALLDAGVLLLLGGFGWFGWKHFRAQS